MSINYFKFVVGDGKTDEAVICEESGKTDEAAAPMLCKNASYHCAQTAQPQFGLVLRRIFT